MPRIVFVSLWFAAAVSAADVSSLTLGAAANENACAVNQIATRFVATQRQAFARVVLTRVRQGESLTLEWMNPAGSVSSTAFYETLPAAPSLCLLSQLPIAGFEPSVQPGTWTLRVQQNGAVRQAVTFEIQGAASALLVTGVARREVAPNQQELTVEGAGFQSGAIVHLAQYMKNDGWRYLAAMLPDSMDGQRLTVTFRGALPAAEYLVIVRNPDDQLSPPGRLIIASASGYRLPIAAGEVWTITQSPYGGFSHWGTMLHAFDLAPRAGGCVAAMRGGLVHAFDRGEGQSIGSRSFGNYVTIDHGDGEFSHYAHLKTGTFVVRTGQRVEPGQALAWVGNSGYSFGTHVHVHVTKTFSIAAQSIPFRFADGANRQGAVVQSSHRNPFSDCRKLAPGPVEVTRGTRPANGPKMEGTVAVADWWNGVLAIPKGTRAAEIQLDWQGKDRGLDLHLISPSGKHYGWYGLTEGYSGRESNPQSFRLPTPEPGPWRVSVQGIKGTGELMDFRVESNFLR